MKIAVLVLANDDVCVCSRCKRAGRARAAAPMIDAVRKTWAAEKVSDVKVYYLYGHRKGIEFPLDSKYIKSDETYWPISKGEGGTGVHIEEKRSPFAIGDCIYSDTPEDYSNLFYKTIDGFQWLLENEDFDYVLRTICGSYVDLHLLKQFVEALRPGEEVYAGSSLSCGHTGIKFASGSAYLVSRGLIEDIVSNRLSVNHARTPYASATIIDDVTVAKHFASRGVGVTHFEKQDFSSKSQITDRAKDVMQCYFVHQYDPELMYAVHEQKIKLNNNER